MVLKSTPPLKKRYIVRQEQDGIVGGCWKDKREVRVLTTKYKAKMVNTGKINRQREISKKPDVIQNATNGNKKLFDEISSYFFL